MADIMEVKTLPDQIASWKDCPDISVTKVADVHSLRARDVARISKLPQLEEAVWQVIVRPLRGWCPRVAPEPDGPRPPGAPPKLPVDMTPVRPLCIFVLGLAPVGRVFGTQPCIPGDEFPSPATILETLVKIMGAPPPHPVEHQQGVKPKPHRPARIVFADHQLAYVCARSLEDIGVRTCIGSPHPRFENILSEFSATLEKKEVLSVQPAHRRKPLHAVAGVTDAHLRALYALTAQVGNLKPWDKISEMQSLRVAWDVPSDQQQRAVWVSVLGHESLKNRQMALSMGRDPRQVPAATRGILISYRRWDLEQRHMTDAFRTAKAQAASSNAAVGGGAAAPVKPVAVTNALDQACACCKKAPAPGVELLACSGCRCVWYCKPEKEKAITCQKADWEQHSSFCKENPAMNAAPATQDMFVPHRDTLLVYEQAISLPLYTVENIAELGCAPPAEVFFNWPFVFTRRQGQVELPKISELIWLYRGLSAFLTMLRCNLDVLITPLAMPSDIDLDVRGQGLPGGGGRCLGSTQEPEWYTLVGDVPLARVRTDPILSREMSETIAARAAEEVKQRHRHLHPEEYEEKDGDGEEAEVPEASGKAGSQQLTQRR